MFNNQNLYDRPMRIRIDKVKVDNDQKILSMSRLPEGLGGVGMGLGSGGQPLCNVRQKVEERGGNERSGAENLGMGAAMGGGAGGGNLNMGGGDTGNILQTALATIATLAAAGGMGGGTMSNTGMNDSGGMGANNRSSDTILVRKGYY